MNKLKHKLINAVFLLKEFGLIYTILYLLSFLWKKAKISYKKKGIKIIYKEFNYVFEKFIGKASDVNFDDSQKNIFIFWAQGFENCPNLQKECVARVKYFYSDFNVKLIDLQNYKEYIQIPNYIEDLFSEKKISIQCFSDILRFNLISKFGGYWVDATILFFKKYPLDFYLEKFKFYSLNINTQEKRDIWGGVYNPCYTTYFFGSRRSNLTMLCAVEFYNEYFKKHEYILDYFLNDYILIICSALKIDENCLNLSPLTNATPYYLCNYLKDMNNTKFDAKFLSECPQKVDWRSFDYAKFSQLVEDNNLNIG